MKFPLEVHCCKSAQPNGSSHPIFIIVMNSLKAPSLEKLFPSDCNVQCTWLSTSANWTLQSVQNNHVKLSAFEEFSTKVKIGYAYICTFVYLFVLYMYLSLFVCAVYVLYCSFTYMYAFITQCAPETRQVNVSSYGSHGETTSSLHLLC